MQKIYFDGTDQYVYFQASKDDYSGEFTGTNDGDALPGAAITIKEYKKAAASITSPEVLWNATLGYWFALIPAAYITQFGGVVFAVSGTGMFSAAIEAVASRAEDYYASAADLTAIKAITDLLTLAAINAEVDTAISDAGLVTKIDTVDTVVDGIATTLATPDNFKADVSSLATSAEIAALSNVAAVGAEKIVPADKYDFDASAKTLTFSSPYDTLTVEQVTFIKNLTTNYIIWDCRYAGYQTLPIRFGAAPNTHVLSFDSSDSDAANNDKIMIVVNQV